MRRYTTQTRATEKDGIVVYRLRRHAATVDASSPVATEILFFEETETQAVFSPDARGYWNLEFPSWFFTRVHGNV